MAERSVCPSDCPSVLFAGGRPDRRDGLPSIKPIAPLTRRRIAGTEPETSTSRSDSMACTCCIVGRSALGLTSKRCTNSARSFFNPGTSDKSGGGVCVIWAIRSCPMPCAVNGGRPDSIS